MPRHTVQPPEWIDAAPIIVDEEIRIDAAPEAVWAHIADHERWPQWFDDLDDVEVTGARSGVGGGRTVTAKRLKLVEEFTAWDENEHFAFAVVKSPIPILATLAESVRIEPDGDGTRVVYRQGVAGRRFLGAAMKLAWRGGPDQVKSALRNLKTLVEDSGSPATN